ncbi:MAG TPA: hypothetical protein EYQ00_03425 [Dehalococcoidia bacterium]|jgi:muconolactone delta-isomerase|nr:hypothetical protein [Dehalococcoidia bacterium]
MLFLVVSTPHPTRPSEVKQYRKQYWEWAQNQLDIGNAQSMYARAGRGGVAIFDVSSNEILHGLLNEWAEIMPAEFDVYPILDPDAIKSYLSSD